MSKLNIITMQGQPAGEYELADDLLECKRGAQAVHEVVLAYLAGLRAGTASTLSKSFVAGTGAKPWRQKGTGQARAGYRQSPIWRGGGVAFGPHPRDYSQRIPRKVAELAFRRAFSDKVVSGELRLLDKLELDGRTKSAAAMLKALQVEDGALIVASRIEAMTLRALRNLPGARLTAATDVTTYELVRHRNVIVVQDAMAVIVKRLAGKNGRKV